MDDEAEARVAVVVPLRFVPLVGGRERTNFANLGSMSEFRELSLSFLPSHLFDFELLTQHTASSSTMLSLVYSLNLKLPSFQ